MPIVPKIAGITSTVASIRDIHKTAMIYSKEEYRKAMGNAVVSKSIGNQKADYISYKDAQRKNWSTQHLLFSGTKETIASIKGYFKGAFRGIIRYLPKFILAAGAIIPKDKGSIISYASTAALGAVELWDFLKNGTGLFERRDYLNKK